MLRIHRTSSMTLDEVRDSLDGDVTIDNSIHTLFILEKQGYPMMHLLAVMREQNNEHEKTIQKILETSQ
jgi:glutamyl/glutaminyl-tRNA synthetase